MPLMPINNIIFFDLETNGLLNDMDRIHCMSYAINNGDVSLLTSYSDMERVVRKMEKPNTIVVAHNGIAFDLEVLHRYFNLNLSKVRAFDTLVVSRFIYPDMNPNDDLLVRKKQLPAKLMGSHSLESWGYRLGEYKDEYDGGWEEYTKEMGDYCIQDTVVLRSLYQKLISEGVPQEVFELESGIQKIIQRQIRHGVKFDTMKAAMLYNTLNQREIELAKELAEVITPWWTADENTLVPKRSNKRFGYVEGAEVQKIVLTHFNPNSTQHIVRYLTSLGWVPEKFTSKGNPSVDDEALSELKYPLIDKIRAYRLVKKRLSMLSDGRYGWLKLLNKGRLHGQVNTNGAVTGRMTHSKPNLAQVPKVTHGVNSEGNLEPLKGEAGGWGYEMRELFTVSEGNVLVGCDASGLELRMLAHFIGRFDSGEYAREIIDGDIHTRNQLAAGLSCRDTAKTFIYGFLYGGGDAKIGEIVGGTAADGAALKKRFLLEVPALAKLIDLLETSFSKNGFIRGLDGRKLYIGASLDPKASPKRLWQRSNHKALNTLLQSAGALVMKKALILLDSSLQKRGLLPSKDYEFVLNIHDEFQLEVKKEYAQLVGELARQSIVDAGLHFKLRCPLDGEFKIGNSWAETH